MDISSNRQLVPYAQKTSQVTRHSTASTGAVPVDSNPAAKRYAQMIPPRSSGHSTQSDVGESVYGSSRRLETQKMNKVGILIDIYT